jgi:hypothetical protein
VVIKKAGWVHHLSEMFTRPSPFCVASRNGDATGTVDLFLTTLRPLAIHLPASDTRMSQSSAGASTAPWHVPSFPTYTASLLLLACSAIEEETFTLRKR